METSSTIIGKTCPSCGRDNSEYKNLCTADDCPGVQKLRVTPMKKYTEQKPQA